MATTNESLLISLQFEYPQNSYMADSPGWGTTDANGNISFSTALYGSYTAAFNKTADTQKLDIPSIVVDANKNFNYSLSPIYVVTVTTGQAGASVILNNPTGGSETKTTDSSGKAVFNDIGVGTALVTVTKTGFETVSKNYTVPESTNSTLTVDCTLYPLPKLVQITSNQTNYAVDTSYKYLSILVVGKGGTPSGNYYNAAGSGMVVCLKNYAPSTSFGYFKRLNSIEFNYAAPGGASTRLVMDRSINNSGNIMQDESQIFAGNGLADKGATYVKFFMNIRTSNIDITNSLDGYGSSGPGITSGGYGYGGAGSSGSKDAGSFYVGGPGGNGRFGFSGNAETGQGGTGTTKGTSIPLTSIFGGTGKGGSGNGAEYSGGGGGYGNGGVFSGTPGYGAGGSETVGGSGIVCLYYHNTEI